ncbi:unnamed protein product [Urochloa humidicola]
MKRDLTWWDLIWFGVGAVIGAGIFVLTGQEARDAVGPAVVVSYVVSGVSAMLSVFCYTEFAVEIPVAGGSFAYLRVELGDFMAFVAAGNILLEYCIGGAAVARAWTSYFATLLNHKPSDFRIHASSLSADYSELDPIAVVVIALVCVFAVASTKGTSRFNYVLSIVHIAVIIFIIVAGLTKADTANMRDFMPYGVRGIFSGSAVLFFAYIGFDAVSTMAEETKNPARDIPIGLVGAMALTTALYCVLAVTLCLMQPYGSIDPDAPFSVAFADRGMDWAKYIVAFGALKGMTTVLLVSAVGQARYLTHIARAHMMPPWLRRCTPGRGRRSTPPWPCSWPPPSSPSSPTSTSSPTCSPSPRSSSSCSSPWRCWCAATMSRGRPRTPTGTSWRRASPPSWRRRWRRRRAGAWTWEGGCRTR